MIINKEEVEKAAKQFSEKVTNGKHFRDLECGFIAGVEFSEEYVQQHVQDLIIENQGLKLYKDNESKRFKKLAIELINWLNLNPQFTDFAEFRMNEKELYELFKKNYIK